MLTHIAQHHLLMLEIAKTHLPCVSSLVPFSLINAGCKRVGTAARRAMGLRKASFNQSLQGTFRLRWFALDLDGQFLSRQALQVTQRH